MARSWGRWVAAQGEQIRCPGRPGRCAEARNSVLPPGDTGGVTTVSEVIELQGEVVARRRGLDLSGLGDDELRAYVLETDRQLSQLTADHARAVAVADDRGVWGLQGDRSCDAWLARRRHRPKQATGAVRRLGRALRHLPLVDAALADGRIAVEHARELARCWRFAPVEFAEWEPDAVEHAAERSWADFVRLCAHWRDVVDPDGTEDRAAKHLERRHLLTHKRYDGVITLHGQLDPIGGEVFLRALRSIEDELWQADWRAATAIHGDDTVAAHVLRTPAQRRADALRIMAERAMAVPAGAKLPVPSVVVYVDYETLTGALCELSDGTTITPRQAASMFPGVDEADVERIVFGPGNRVIELGRRERFYRGGLQRAIQLRDRHCTYNGCDIPADRCHVDHIVEYANGGETTEENGRLRCPPHNPYRRSRHEPPPDWTPTQQRAGPALTDDDIDTAIRARVQSLIDRRAA
jgi:hypothetical protein